MEDKIKALGQYFSAMLMRDYQNAILGGGFHYIHPRPARHFGRLFYLALLLTGTLLTAFYQMINPGELLPMFGNMAALGRPLLAMAVWSTLCCYLTLRLMRGAANCQPRELARWIPGLVWVLAAVFVGRLFGQDLPAFVENWRSGNFFALITLMAAAVPTVFSIRTTCAAGRLLEALTCGRYSAQAVEAADRLADTCRTALAVTPL